MSQFNDGIAKLYRLFHRAWMSNYIQQTIMGCIYLFMVQYQINYAGKKPKLYETSPCIYILRHHEKSESLEGFILTHWGRVTQICVGKLTIIGSDYGLSPGRRQAIIWTNAGILLIGPLGTNFSEILIAIETFSFKKMHLKMSSAKWRPFCLGLNVLSNKRQQPVTKYCRFIIGMIKTGLMKSDIVKYPFQPQESIVMMLIGCS